MRDDYRSAVTRALRCVSPLLACAALSACVPVPTYKTLRPEAHMTVRNEAGDPLAGAAVHLISGAYPRGPTGWERDRTVAYTGVDGTARFEAIREWRVEVPLMIHGSLHYSWHWCVAKPGYRTWLTDRRHNPFSESADIVLERAQGEDEGESCELPMWAS